MVTFHGVKAQASSKAQGLSEISCRFESLVGDLLNRTKQPCKDCMKDAGVSASEINEVLLVGGQTRMPRVSLIFLHCPALALIALPTHS